MRGLLPRSLASPIPEKPDRGSGSRCSLIGGDPFRLGPGPLCRSSERSPARSGCGGEFSAGTCVPSGAGDGGPLSTEGEQHRSPYGRSPSLHPPCPGGVPFPPGPAVSTAGHASSWPLLPPSVGHGPLLYRPPAQLVPPQKGCPLPGSQLGPDPLIRLWGPTPAGGGTHGEVGTQVPRYCLYWPPWGGP